jgi:hypothetical protein
MPPVLGLLESPGKRADPLCHPYAGEIVTGDHIIPRSVTPELDNTLFNLDMMPLTLNRKRHKIGRLIRAGYLGDFPLF